MPHVRPFRGLRYADTSPAAMARVLAPPFDMIKGQERRTLLSQDENNAAWLTIADDGPGYPGVAERLARWKAAGIVERDPEPALYAYEQTQGEVRLRGFLGAVRLANPPEDAVYGHENTFAQPIMDRLALLRATEVMLEPVFGIYTDDSGRTADTLAAAMGEPPLWEAETADGTAHRLWRVTDGPTQTALCDVLADRSVVIADGHHRWAAAKAYREEKASGPGADSERPHEYALMLLVDERTGGVECGAFHRVIQRLVEGIDPARLADHLGPHFAVEELPIQGVADEAAVRAVLDRIASEAADGPAFGCRWQTGAAIVRVRDIEALLATATREIDPLVREFDVALLHRLILRPRLGCHGDYSPQARAVTFEKDPVVAWRQVSTGGAVMAWLVNPAPISAVMRAACAGLTVPQKATHFHPKPPSGMVMYDLTA